MTEILAINVQPGDRLQDFQSPTGYVTVSHVLTWHPGKRRIIFDNGEFVHYPTDQILHLVTKKPSIYVDLCNEVGCGCPTVIGEMCTWCGTTTGDKHTTSCPVHEVYYATSETMEIVR